MSNRRKNQGKGSGRRRDDLLQVWLANVEKRTFEAAAGLAGIGLSAWVRERLRRAAIRELEEAGREIPLFSEKDRDEP